MVGKCVNLLAQNDLSGAVFISLHSFTKIVKFGQPDYFTKLIRESYFVSKIICFERSEI
jgi:hypothetical protein